MIELYNTLSKKIEKFIPIEKNILKIYSCGPTVYSRQHIGNLRSALCWDFLKRIFRYFDYEIIDVINITDVGHLTDDADFGEDKMEKASKLEKLNPLDIAEKYMKLYFDDFKKLNIIFPKFFPRATQTIKKQIEVIEKIKKNGFAYEIEDGIYFDTQKYKKYGLLSNKKIELENLKNRIEKNSKKKHPFDFALWKFLTGKNKEHTLKWESPFGMGFPGWHIECSAMSKKYLGEKFDIHTGGIEHIQIHHEAEIAQNLGSNENSKINFWLHNQHLIVNGEKMSKSLKNTYNLDDLEKKGFDFLDFRFLCLKFHYRNVMNFTFEELSQARKERIKLKEFVKKLKE